MVKQYPSNNALKPSIMLNEFAIPTKEKIKKTKAKVSNLIPYQ